MVDQGTMKHKFRFRISPSPHLIPTLSLLLPAHLGGEGGAAGFCREAYCVRSQKYQARSGPKLQPGFRSPPTDSPTANPKNKRKTQAPDISAPDHDFTRINRSTVDGGDDTAADRRNSPYSRYLNISISITHLRVCRYLVQHTIPTLFTSKSLLSHVYQYRLHLHHFTMRYTLNSAKFIYIQQDKKKPPRTHYTVSNEKLWYPPP